METNVHTIDPEATFEEILNLLIEHRISGTPVVDSDKKLIGIISEKDLLEYLFPSESEYYSDVRYWKDPHHLESEAKRVVTMKAKDLLTTDVITVRPKTKVMTACSLLLVHNIRRLPVVDEGTLVGIVTSNDLYKNFLKTLV
ncbi:CBS domain-containing protein [candidate division WWE3 bacterium]|uniref:CBS domain-containing protein n=1 Tax=candidate division WWE3 bacterium TaxID=2053526 RepID=A0A955RX64_UNCKA|nr:CBS domain-containing protein [candidate division WWE3 bacterium]